MTETFRVLMAMGGLQRLFPFWVGGMAVLIFAFNPWFILAVAYGVLMQLIVEYLMHRFVYHREPPQHQPTFNALYRTHIGHHEFPSNPEFLTGDDHWFAVRFGLVSVALHTLLLLPFIDLVPALGWSIVALFVGSISAFTFYQYCHTLAHLNVPKGWFGQRVTRSHMSHHFKDHSATYHVSFGMGWIDQLFGTYYDQEKAKARYDPATIMSMGMDPEDTRLVIARKAFGLSRNRAEKESVATASLNH